MKHIEAMKQALEALEFYYDQHGEEKDGQAITALRQAIEQAEQAQPVVRWICKGCGHEYMEAPSSCDCMESTEYERVEYYTSPSPRQPLTNEDLRQLADKHLYYQPEGYVVSGVFDFARAIEAAHGIKGEA